MGQQSWLIGSLVYSRSARSVSLLSLQKPPKASPKTPQSLPNPPQTSPQTSADFPRGPQSQMYEKSQNYQFLPITICQI